MNTRPRFNWVFILILGLGLASCAEVADPTPDKVTVYDRPFVSFAPFYIADQRGYFAEQGIEVEFVSLPSSVGSMTAAIQGQIDVAGVFLTANLMNGFANASNIRLVADKGYLDQDGCTANALVARTALIETGLSGPSDLAGLRVAMSPTTVEEYFVGEYLMDAGLSLGDIQAIELPIPSELAALGDGSIDLVATGEPWITRMVEAGFGQVWLAFEDLYPDFQYAFLLFGEKLLNDRDLGNRFMVAYLEGVADYNEGKTEDNVRIVADFTGMEPDFIPRTCWAPFRQGGEINSTSIEEYQIWAVDQGLMESVVGLDRIWDGSFLQAAKEELGRR